MALLTGMLITTSLQGEAETQAEKDANVALQEGKQLRKAGKFEQSILLFDKALAKNGNLADGYYSRARAKLSTAKFEQAIEDCNRAIALNPKLAEYFHLRGDLYGAVRQPEKAIKDFSTAISLDPKDAVAFRGRGTARYQLDLYKEALADYTQALQLNPNTWDVYINRSRILAEMKQYNLALKDAESAFSLTSKEAPGGKEHLDVTLFTNRGRAHLGLNQIDKALADLTKAINSTGKPEAHAEAFYYRAQAYEKLASDDKATALKLGFTTTNYRPAVSQIKP